MTNPQFPQYAAFTPEGHCDNGEYSYRLKSGARLYLRPDEHTKFGLLQLAGPDFWLDVAPDKRGAVDWDKAAAAAMHACHEGDAQ